MALAVVAPHVSHADHLRGSLHSFGDHIKAQDLSQRDDRSDDLGVLAIGSDT